MSNKPKRNPFRMQQPPWQPLRIVQTTNHAGRLNPHISNVQVPCMSMSHGSDRSLLIRGASARVDCGLGARRAQPAIACRRKGQVRCRAHKDAV